MDKISVSSSQTTKSAGSDGYCGYCSERIDFMVDPRELSCSHVYCLPCIQSELLQNTKLTCATCKAVYESVDIEALSRVDKLMLSDAEDDQPPINCDVCKDSSRPALTFCINCSKKLCQEHQQYHDEYQEAFSKTEHKKISIDEYRFSPDRYQIKTCAKHDQQEVRYSCAMCLKKFCEVCDTKKKCPAAREGSHEVRLIDDISIQYKEQLNKLLNCLSSKITDAYSIEKRTTEDMSAVEHKVQRMCDEVDRVLQDQISAITRRANALKTDISVYRFQNSNVVNDFVSKLRKQKDDLGDLWKSTHRLMTQRHDTEIIQTFSIVKGEIEKAMAIQFGQCQLPLGRMLVRTAEHRDIEIRLEESVPLLMEIKQRHKQAWLKYCCVCALDQKDIIISQEAILEIADANALSSVKKSSKTTANINGICAHDKGCAALHWSNRKNYIILYSKELEFLKLVGEFFRTTDKYSQISASLSHIVALDPDSKQLYVYNTKGAFLFNTKLGRTKRPWGVQCLPDGTVLVSDFMAGSVKKYSLTKGSSEPIWTCIDLIAPTGITINSSGLIYVASFTGRKIYIISNDGKKLKELTNPDLEKIKEVYDITVSEDQLTLACGHDGLLQFQMIYDALVF